MLEMLEILDYAMNKCNIMLGHLEMQENLENTGKCLKFLKDKPRNSKKINKVLETQENAGKW